MDKNKNPLGLEVNSLGKRFFKLLFMIIISPFILSFFYIVVGGNWYIESSRNIVIFSILVTLFAVFRVFNKDACGAMRAVRGYMTYEELEKYLEHEEFKKIDGCIIKMEVSDKWIKLDGVFIPKNFVSAIYIFHETRSNFLVVMLINGREFSTHLSPASYETDNEVDIMMKILPNARNIINWYYSDEKKLMKEKFEEQLKSGKTVDMFIKQWDSDFDFKNFNKYEKNFK